MSPTYNVLDFARRFAKSISARYIVVQISVLEFPHNVNTLQFLKH